MPNPTPVLLALLLLVSNVVAAQKLEPGARVRIRPPCERDAPCDPIIGQFRSIQGDTVVLLTPDGQTRSHVLTRTTRFDLSHGMRGQWLEGLGIGLAAGVAVGFLAKSTCEGSGSRGESLCGIYYLFTVPPALLLGGIVGAHHKTELWLPARRMTVAVTPTRDGVGLGMRLAL
ncbi:MAG: hypothetical protein ABI542_12795 [Gemmatimonadota bacterium]